MMYLEHGETEIGTCTRLGESSLSSSVPLSSSSLTTTVSFSSLPFASFEAAHPILGVPLPKKLQIFCGGRERVLGWGVRLGWLRFVRTGDLS
eukprot:1412393-Rhodomonas_salina.3